MATPPRIRGDAGSASHDVSGLIGDADFEHELLADLALSVGAAVVWWLDLDADQLGWMPGLDAVIGVPGSDTDTVRARLAELVAPLTVAARTAPAWQDFELEQPLETPDGPRRLQFRARVSTRGSARALVGVVADVTRRHTQQQELADLADRYRLLVELSPRRSSCTRPGCSCTRTRQRSGSCGLARSVRSSGGRSPTSSIRTHRRTCCGGSRG